jgi:predicted transposase YbfD/YdcC
LKQPPEESRRPLPPEDLAEASTADRVAKTQDKGHGRCETRTLRTTSILTLTHKWPGMKQGFEITRERTIKGVKTVEVVYGMTSLSAEQANAKTLLQIVRDHWKIENELHYVRDVTLGEDLCRVRSGTAPQVLAALRNAVVHLLSGVDAKSHQEAIEKLQIDLTEAKKLIGIPQTE